MIPARVHGCRRNARRYQQESCRVSCAEGTRVRRGTPSPAVECHGCNRLVHRYDRMGETLNPCPSHDYSFHGISEHDPGYPPPCGDSRCKGPFAVQERSKPPGCCLAVSIWSKNGTHCHRNLPAPVRIQGDSRYLFLLFSALPLHSSLTFLQGILQGIFPAVQGRPKHRPECTGIPQTGYIRASDTPPATTTGKICT